MKGGSTAIIETKKDGTGKQVTDERESQKQKQSRSHNQLKKGEVRSKSEVDGKRSANKVQKDTKLKKAGVKAVLEGKKKA